MKLKIDCELATFSFESTTNQESDDLFGVNGLPLTPASTKIVGNFHSFVNSFNSSFSLSEYLVTYLDCIRNKNEKVTLVFEHHSRNGLIHPEMFSDIITVIKHGLSALKELHHEFNTSHGLITPSSIVFASEENHFKLSHWALNLLTDGGRLCNCWFVPQDVRFMSLEQLLSCRPSRKSDVWSFALSILFIIFPKCSLSTDPIEFLSSVTSFDSLLAKLDISTFAFNTLDETVRQFLTLSLQPDPTQRSSLKDLLALFGLQTSKVDRKNIVVTPIQHLLNRRSLTSNVISDPNLISNLSLHDLYYLYRITTKDARHEKNQKRLLPPILTLPKLIILETESTEASESYSITSEKNGKDFLAEKSGLRLIRVGETKLLPLGTVNERLECIAEDIFCPLLFSPDISENIASPRSTLASLPLSIREMDFDYQCQRLMTFKTLLNGYPFLRNQLITDAKVDISPHFRPQIWAALLNVQWSDLLLYERIDKISATSTDRQIDVDIPRCHQYNDLLASEEGHRKLTRILKAWLADNEVDGEVYWQGLDSLAAPFVLLNFNNEPLAFACFRRFIKKYLSGFFQKDNSNAIQEYLALFQIVTTFHDPIMSNHFAELGFVPDLYAISWFLTIFTHILPLYQIVQLWDTLILGNDSFALFIGLSILHQLRDRILDFTFNDCILTFSDLPQIDIDRCARNSVKFFRSTPKSISKRGLWKFEDLRTFSRLPRVHIDDLVEMMANYRRLTNEETDHNTVHLINVIVIVDCRTPEEVASLGSFANSFTFEEYSEMISQEEKPSKKKDRANKILSNATNQHNLLVVVNSIERTMELIEVHKVPRVAYLEIHDQIPRSLT